MIIKTIQRDASVAKAGAAIRQYSAKSEKLRPTTTSKVAFDKVFAVFALAIFSPVFLVISGLILAFEGRQIFFGHTRIGQNGKPFQCWKFRTMVLDAEQRLEDALRKDPALRQEWNETRKMKNDPRINKLGRFLRKTSLDELPQFWNVLKGEMSVVGPRPVVANELPYYGVHVRDYASVRPGLTGAWQVSGRSNTTYDERVALDVNYIRHGSMWDDMSIILRTFRAILGQSGAH